MNKNDHKELLKLGDKIDKIVDQARQVPAGKKPILMGPSAPGKSSKYINLDKKGSSDNATK
ncbi:hypothetical protein YDYSY3_39310 [Paenibacillus chitinolyticus]|nr:hypothetical protein YDYSY3_39310 [Paenibacillus chitinolyticus]